jgi:hypothetical protein
LLADIYAEILEDDVSADIYIYIYIKADQLANMKSMKTLIDLHTIHQINGFAK